MNYRLTAVVSIAFGLYGCDRQAEPMPQDTATIAPAQVQTLAATAEPELASGISFEGFNTKVRPQDDLFEYVNGKWVSETELPADRARWGTFDKLREQSEDDVKVLVESVSAAENIEDG